MGMGILPCPAAIELLSSVGGAEVAHGRREARACIPGGRTVLSDGVRPTILFSNNPKVRKG